MLRPTVSLAVLALCLAWAGGASAHGGDSAERADRGGRADRPDRAERADRDRAKDAEKASRDRDRDAQKASERTGRDAAFSSSGSGTGSGNAADGASLADPDETSGEDRLADANGDAGSDNGLDQASGNSGSGSDDPLQDNSGSSDANDLDEDDNSGEGSSGSDNGDADDDSDEDGSDEEDSEEDDEADADGDDGDTGEGENSASLVSDDSGHLYRDREVLILLPETEELERLTAAGFSVIEKRPLRRDGALLVRVGFAQDVKAADALSEVRSLYPAAAIDFSHVYKASSETGGVEPEAVLPDKLDDRRSDVRIAVIDGFSSSDLPEGVELKSFVKRASDVAHGAQVMSVLLADLDQIGEGHPERLLAADVAERFKDAGSQASVYNLVEALDWAASEGADIINISLAGPPNQVLGAVVESLQGDGVLMFAAVGNTGPASQPGYPAAYGAVVGVTAVSSNGTPYLYAARGEEVELSAQGVELRLTPGSNVLSGTSFAVPRVVALAAWMMDGEPSGNFREGLRALAKDLGAPGRDNIYGYGVLPTPDELKLD